MFMLNSLRENWIHKLFYNYHNNNILWSVEFDHFSKLSELRWSGRWFVFSSVKSLWKLSHVCIWHFDVKYTLRCIFFFFFLSGRYWVSLLPNSLLVMRKKQKSLIWRFTWFFDYKKALNSVACKFVLQTPENQGFQENCIK